MSSIASHIALLAAVAFALIVITLIVLLRSAASD